MKPLRVAVLCGLLCANLLAAAGVALAPDFDSEETIGLILGLMFGQIGVAAGVTALPTLHWVWRIPLGVGLAFQAVLSAALLIARTGPAPDGLVFLLFLGGALLVQWLTIQAPLWLLRWLGGWRVAHPEDLPAAAAPHRERQFRLWHLLAWMLGLSVLLGIGRATLPWLGADAGPALRELEMVFIFLILAGCSAALGVMLIGAVLAPRWPFLWTPLSLLGVAGLAQLQVLLFTWITGRGTSDDVWVLWSLMVCQASWLLGHLLVVRLLGYRLTQAVTRPATEAGGAVPDSPFAVEPPPPPLPWAEKGV